MVQVEDSILFCAFRYALGRKTYVVSEVCDQILLNLKNIEKKYLYLMIKEINEAKYLGMDIDKEKWYGLVKTIRRVLNESS